MLLLKGKPPRLPYGESPVELLSLIDEAGTDKQVERFSKLFLEFFRVDHVVGQGTIFGAEQGLQETFLSSLLVNIGTILLVPFGRYNDPPFFAQGLEDLVSHTRWR